MIRVILEMWCGVMWSNGLNPLPTQEWGRLCPSRWTNRWLHDSLCTGDVRHHEISRLPGNEQD